MKSKLLILTLAAVFLWGRDVKADTVIDYSATRCDMCFGVPTDLDARFTLELKTGSFFDLGLLFTYNGPVYEVTGITGTFDGNPISFLPAPQGDGSFLFTNFVLGTIYFSAGGSKCWLMNDGSFDLLEVLDANGDGYGTSTAIRSSITVVSTPEPTAGCLLLLGIGAIGLGVWAIR